MVRLCECEPTETIDNSQITPMPAVRRSPRNSKTKSAQAPSAPPTILTDRCSDDLAQKVAQILEFFEGEVIRSREVRRLTLESRDGPKLSLGS